MFEFILLNQRTYSLSGHLTFVDLNQNITAMPGFILLSKNSRKDHLITLNGNSFQCHSIKDLVQHNTKLILQTAHCLFPGYVSRKSTSSIWTAGTLLCYHPN